MLFLELLGWSRARLCLLTILLRRLTSFLRVSDSALLIFQRRKVTSSSIARAMDRPNSMKSATKTMSTAPKRLLPYASAILFATNMHTMMTASTTGDIFILKNMTLPFHEEAQLKAKGHFLPLRQSLGQKANIYINN